MFQISGPMLGTALLDFTNLVLSGGVPKEVRHVFFWANLHALRKKDGGLRPIAVSLTLRRLLSKVANKWGSARMAVDLAPRQLGMANAGYMLLGLFWIQRQGDRHFLN